MTDIWTNLANTTPAASGRILTLVVLITVAAIVLIALAFWLRRWLTGDEEEGVDTSGYTLEELKRMHAEGQLSDEEFAQAKAALISALSVTPVEPGGGDEGSGARVVPEEKKFLNPQSPPEPDRGEGEPHNRGDEGSEPESDDQTGSEGRKPG